MCFVLAFLPYHAFSKGKIYGNSKTISKEHIKYEKCRLRKTELNIKDGEKDGYKCIYKRQKKGKDVTVSRLPYVKNLLNVKLKNNS